MKTEQQYTGVLPITPEQESRLIRLEELVPSAAGIKLEKIDPTKWRVWPKRDQDGSSSCTYQARAKAAGILRELVTGEFVEYSAADYNKRSNAPSEGSSPVEAFDNWKTRGVGLEIFEPSQLMADSGIAKTKQTPFEKDVAAISKIDNYVMLPLYDFDALVSTLAATKKPIPIGIFGTTKEWSQDVPKIIDKGLTAAKAPVRHEICATPNFGIYNGEEGFTIEDSWGSAGIDGKGVRWITRAFFEKRNYIPGLYPTTFKTFQQLGVVPTRPTIKLTRDLEFGITGADVRALQEVYRYEGFFPANHAGSELFHNLTEECTRQFQVRHGIVSSGTPKTTGFGRVGPSTRAVINKLYGN